MELKKIYLKFIMGYKLFLKIIIWVILIMFSLTGCHSVQNDFISKVQNEFIKQPLKQTEILTKDDISHLPTPVKKYIEYTGAIGKSKINNVQIKFDAKMIKKPGANPMETTSVQYNFYENYSRLFFMKASTFLVPIRVFHSYIDQNATFVVRVASLFNAVDKSGENLTTAETVTLLNDLCIFAPSTLIDKRLTWKEIDSLSSQVTLENGKYIVSAILYFNEKGELINFISDDRLAIQDDGSMRKARWSTPIRDYKDFGGRKIPTYGETTWNYPEGDFTYGTFSLRSIKYNLKQIEED